MIVFNESELVYMHPLIVANAEKLDIAIELLGRKFKIEQCLPVSSDFECDGCLMSVETGGVLKLSNRVELTYSLKDDTAQINPASMQALEELIYNTLHF